MKEDKKIEIKKEDKIEEKKPKIEVKIEEKKGKIEEKVEKKIEEKKIEIKQEIKVEKPKSKAEIKRQEIEKIDFSKAFRLFKKIKPEAKFYDKGSVLVYVKKRMPSLIATKEEYMELLKKY